MRRVRFFSAIFVSVSVMSTSAVAAPTFYGQIDELANSGDIVYPEIEPAETLTWKEAAAKKPKLKPKPGALNAKQKAAFKTKKKTIKVRERRNIRLVKQWMPAVKRAQRTQVRTSAARAASRNKISKMEAKMNAFREKARAKQVGKDPLAAALTPAFSTKVQAKLDHMQAAINRAEVRHANGPRRQDLNAQAQLTSAQTQLNQAELGRDAARAELKVRKVDKNHARSQNLQQAIQAKVQRAVRAGPLVTPTGARAQGIQPVRQNIYGAAPAVVATNGTYMLAPHPAAAASGVYGALPQPLSIYGRVTQPLLPE